MKHIIIFLILIIANGTSICQKKNKYLIKGKELYNSGEYYESIDFLKRAEVACKDINQKGEINYLIGMAYMNTIIQIPDSLKKLLIDNEKRFEIDRKDMIRYLKGLSKIYNLPYYEDPKYGPKVSGLDIDQPIGFLSQTYLYFNRCRKLSYDVPKEDSINLVNMENFYEKKPLEPLMLFEPNFNLIVFVLDALKGQPLEGITVVLKDSITNKKIISSTTNEKGEFHYALQKNKSYKIEVNSTNYLSASNYLNTKNKNLKISHKFIEEVILQKIGNE